MNTHLALFLLLAHNNTRELNEEEKNVYAQLQASYVNKIIIVHTEDDSSALRQTQGEFLGCTASLCQFSNNKSFILSLSMDVPCNNKKCLHVSSKTKNNINTLEQMIQQKIATLFADIASPFLLNQRQHNLLLALETKLIDIETMLNSKQIAYELLSIHLNDAIAHLAELSGKEISETSMDMIFREFCVGK